MTEYSIGMSCATAHFFMFGSLDHWTQTTRTGTISNVSPRSPGAAVAGGDNWRPTFQTILKVLAVLCCSPSRPSSINSLRRFSPQCKLENLKIETRYVYAEWFLAEIGIGSSFYNIQQVKIKLIKVLRTRQHQKLQTFPCKFDV